MQPSLLVVEDDETIRETVRDALELEGFAVVACGNGRDALQILQRAPEGEGFSLVVLDLMLPGRAVGSFRIVQAELHVTPVGAEREQVVKQDVLLTFSADPTAAYEPRVMNLVEKVTAFKLQTRALAEAELGNMSGATQKLRAAATRLLDLGELDLAEKTLQHADQLEQGAKLSAETQKELKYATRRLTQKFEE